MAQEAMEPGELPPPEKLNPVKGDDGIWRLTKVRHRALNGSYPRTSGSGRTRKECLADWMNNFKRNRDKGSVRTARGERPSKSDLSLSDKMSKAFDLYIVGVQKQVDAGKVREQSLNTYQRVIYVNDGPRARGDAVKLMTELGDLQIRHVGRPKYLVDYFEDMLEVGPGIAAGHYMILTAVFNMLTAEGLFDVSPMHVVPALDGGGGKQRALKAGERDGFFELVEQRARHEWLKPFLYTLLGTGVRTGEAMAIRWVDLIGVTDPEGGNITLFVCGSVVPKKGGRIRQPRRKRGKNYHVILPMWLSSLLRAWFVWVGPRDLDEPAFESTADGWLSVATLSRAMGNVRDGTEYEWVTCGNFRDTAATHVTGVTGDEDRATAQLGHTASGSVAVRFYIDEEGFQHPAVDNAEALESLCPRKVALMLESGGLEPGWFRV